MQPLPYSTPQRSSADEQHLNLLSIFHFVWGGLIALGACVGLLYSVIGMFVMAAPMPPPMPPRPGGAPAVPGAAAAPQFIGSMFTCIGTTIVIVGWVYGLLNIYSGICIRARKASVFSLILAGFNCMQVPLGVALGIFTFVVLSRDSVKALYAARTVLPLPPPINSANIAGQNSSSNTR